MAKKWMSAPPFNCELCNKPLVRRFVDGKTTMGPWALMCTACHHDQGIGLGEGRGQMYDLKTLEKVGG
jgi:hypothetical protein